jgi:hypothetical protein
MSWKTFAFPAICHTIIIVEEPIRNIRKRSSISDQAFRCLQTYTKAAKCGRNETKRIFIATFMLIYKIETESNLVRKNQNIRDRTCIPPRQVSSVSF